MWISTMILSQRTITRITIALCILSCTEAISCVWRLFFFYDSSGSHHHSPSWGHLSFLVFWSVLLPFESFSFIDFPWFIFNLAMFFTELVVVFIHFLRLLCAIIDNHDPPSPNLIHKFTTYSSCYRDSFYLDALSTNNPSNPPHQQSFLFRFYFSLIQPSLPAWFLLLRLEPAHWFAASFFFSWERKTGSKISINSHRCTVSSPFLYVLVQLWNKLSLGSYRHCRLTQVSPYLAYPI